MDDVKPAPKPKPVWAIYKKGAVSMKVRMLWDEYDSRRPRVYIVLGPRDQRIITSRSHLTFLND
jgi:hypothetical protein